MIWKLIYALMPMLFKIHWGRVTHICVSKLTIISSDNGLSPEGRQAIIWTNAGILLIGPTGNKLRWNFNRIYSNIFIEEDTFENVVCEMLFILSRPQCVNLISAGKIVTQTRAGKIIYKKCEYHLNDNIPSITHYFKRSHAYARAKLFGLI